MATILDQPADRMADDALDRSNFWLGFAVRAVELVVGGDFGQLHSVDRLSPLTRLALTFSLTNTVSEYIDLGQYAGKSTAESATLCQALGVIVPGVRVQGIGVTARRSYFDLIDFSKIDWTLGYSLNSPIVVSLHCENGWGKRCID